MDQPPLIRLPAELRNHIYELALLRGHPVEIKIYDDDVLSPVGYDVLALTRTCKQIRHESTGLFYSINEFHIQLRVGSLKFWYQAPRTMLVSMERHLMTLLRSFVDSIGARNATSLTSVTLQLGEDVVFEDLRRRRNKNSSSLPSGS
ncbi:hypothetical protein LTR85_009424 [Meristemomyces frigidus]|nr:hypothetical protein LTR85_009424 [Meristemomyces frigidus]